MGMIVRQYITEDRELVDDLNMVPVKVDVFNYAAGSPPPGPPAVNVPFAGHLCPLRKIIYVDQLNQAAHPHALSIEPLQYHVQIRAQRHGNRRQQPCQEREDAPGPLNLQPICRYFGVLLPPILFGTKSIQVVPHAKTRRDQQAEPARLPHVIGNLRQLAGQMSQRRNHPVAKIVVTDRIAGQPRIARRIGRAAPDSIDEHQVHRLLGVADRRVM